MAMRKLLFQVRTITKQSHHRKPQTYFESLMELNHHFQYVLAHKNIKKSYVKLIKSLPRQSYVGFYT